LDFLITIVNGAKVFFLVWLFGPLAKANCNEFYSAYCSEFFKLKVSWSCYCFTSIRLKPTVMSFILLAVQSFKT